MKCYNYFSEDRCSQSVTAVAHRLERLITAEVQS